MIRDQRGVTVIELVVSTMAGMTVFLGLTMVVLGAMHQTNRVTKHVHATQDARTVLHRIVTELHSACVSVDVAPIQENSSGSSMTFVYQTGSAAALTPVLHKVSLSGGKLTLSTYNSTSGSTPKWTFEHDGRVDPDPAHRGQRGLRSGTALPLLQVRKRRDLLDAPDRPVELDERRGRGPGQPRPPGEPAGLDHKRRQGGGDRPGSAILRFSPPTTTRMR